LVSGRSPVDGHDNLLFKPQDADVWILNIEKTEAKNETTRMQERASK
jgi:hypothetical protein